MGYKIVSFRTGARDKASQLEPIMVGWRLCLPEGETKPFAGVAHSVKHPACYCPVQSGPFRFFELVGNRDMTMANNLQNWSEARNHSERI